MKKRPAHAAAMAILAALAISGEAQAQSCSLRLINSVPLSLRSGLLTVPASVNGTEMPFVIDTAALANQMNRDAVTSAFKLSTETSEPASISGGAALARVGGPLAGAVNPEAATNVFDTRGNVFRGTATVKEFQMGAMLGAHTFTITDFPAAGTGGILSAEYFQRFDLDLNPVSGKLNVFLPNTCKDKVLYWRAPGVASLPMTYKDNRIKVRVSVDGKEMDAIIDTGAPTSLIKMVDAARMFGIDTDSPGVTATASGNYAYDFKTLSFGDVSIRNPHLQLTRSVLIRGADPAPRTGSRLRNTTDSSDLPPLVIGADLLKRLHVYIAFNDRMIHVTQGEELPQDTALALPVVAVTPFRP